MILSNVGMLAVESNRTRLYLQQMVRHQLIPSIVLLMEDSTKKTPESRAMENYQLQRRLPEEETDLSVTISVRDYLEKNNIYYKILPGIDPNSLDIVKAVTECSALILIYSGPGGAILRQEILSTGKRFLHVHPGFLPAYGGSTTIYYSLLKENACGASAFFMTDKIDAGPIVRREIYPPPKEKTSIDLWYDPYIRSDLLIKVLNDYVDTGCIESQSQPEDGEETYYIIHPVLKHIAILSN